MAELNAFMQKSLEEKESEDKASKRRNYSKYDIIRIRVILESHSYVFSRFLVSRLLTLIKVSPKDSIKITLNLKKFLVEEKKAELPQNKFEEYLFKIMLSCGYGLPYVERFKMISKFYSKRVPLIILIIGTRCMCKSTIVTQLAERINVSNILQTSAVYDILTKLKPEINESSLWNKDLADTEFISVYNDICRVVRNGVNFDILKSLNEGKPVIIEGYHTNPDFYIKETKSDDKLLQLQILSQENVKGLPIESPEAKITADISKANQKGLILIPIFLSINEKDHYVCIENRYVQLHNIYQADISEIDVENNIKIQLRNYQRLQKYLTSKINNSIYQIKININEFEEALDSMHQIVLDKIEDCYRRGEF